MSWFIERISQTEQEIDAIMPGDENAETKAKDAGLSQRAKKAELRQERLAAELRANLKRRKDLGRAKQRAEREDGADGNENDT